MEGRRITPSRPIESETLFPIFMEETVGFEPTEEVRTPSLVFKTSAIKPDSATFPFGLPGRVSPDLRSIPLSPLFRLTLRPTFRQIVGLPIEQLDPDVAETVANHNPSE